MDALNSSSKALERALAMTGSEGEASYFANSTMEMRFTKGMRPLLKSFLEQTSERLLLNKNSNINAMRIADTGCAVGAITLVAMDTIVETFKMFCINNSLTVPEFQGFFCDLPSNDFNTLLRTLPPFSEEKQRSYLASSTCEIPVSRSYFGAVVSGSHHMRLFPCKSMHFFHSTISLMWLSRVPPQVEDRSSAAWNGNHIFICNEEVAEAHYKQFRCDITSFLKARAEELVGGGGLFIGLLGRQSKDPKQQGGAGAFVLHMENVLKDMIAEGIVERRALEDFNMPQYAPCVEEMEEILSEHEEWYEKVEVKLLTGFPLQTMDSVEDGEEAAFGLSQEMLYKSLFYNMLSAHFGWEKNVLDDFFGRLNVKASKNPNQFLCDKIDILVAYLIRKEDISI